jgi:hypothetical protein
LEYAILEGRLRPLDSHRPRALPAGSTCAIVDLVTIGPLRHINPDHFLETPNGRVWTEAANAAAWEASRRALEESLSAAPPGARLYLLVGAQGAGKSTWARRRVRDDGRALVFDAILVRRSERAPLLSRAALQGIPAVAVWFRTPLEVCLARNAARAADEVADEGGLRNVFAALEPPSVDEGFEEVINVEWAREEPSAMPGFVVLYRWRLREGMEDQFVAAWSRITARLRSERGSLGSRLHRGSDDLWYGYAQWPSAEARARAFAGDPVDAEASRQMREAIAESLPETVLEPVADFLVLPEKEDL